MDKLPDRKTIRLKGYDYRANGVYHVTICTHNREYRFGIIVNGEMLLNATGRIAHDNAKLIPVHYPEVELIDFIIMPNHAHLLLGLGTGADANYGVPTRQHTLGQIIRAYKASVSRLCGNGVWQSRFYEHIIRGEQDYLDTITYIQNNPVAWEKDDYYLPAIP